MGVTLARPVATKLPAKLEETFSAIMTLEELDTTQTRLGRPRASFSPPPYSMVKLDDAGGQVFATIDSAVLNNEDSLKSIVSRISNNAMIGKWGGKTLYLSLFTRKENAFPETKIAPKDRAAWKSDYLAYYDAMKKELVLYPKIPSKRKKILFDMCSEPEVSNFHDVHCGKKKPRVR